jgi:hypothetical protein
MNIQPCAFWTTLFANAALEGASVKQGGPLANTITKAVAMFIGLDRIDKEPASLENAA